MKKLYLIFSLTVWANTILFSKAFKNIEWFAVQQEVSPVASDIGFTFGLFAAWDEYRIGIHGDKHIATKLVDKPFTLMIANLDGTGTSIAPKDIHTRVFYGLCEPDDGGICSAFLPDTEIREFWADSFTSEDKTFISHDAYKKLSVGFKFCSLYAEDNGRYQIREDSECSGAMLKGREVNTAPRWRIWSESINMFSVRPDRFELKFPSTIHSSLLISGQDYQFKITALKWSTTAHVVPSYQSTDPISLEYNLSRLLPSGAIDLNDVLEGNLTKYADIYFVNGISDDSGDPYAAPISYSNVGMVSVTVIDKTWSNIDSDDTPDSCKKGIKEGIDVPTGRFICGYVSPTFIPHHFSIENITLKNHNDGNFTYLNQDQDPLDDNNDIAMSAHIGLTILAKNAFDRTTSNFKKDYYENNVTVTLDIPSNPLLGTGYTHDIPTPKELLGFGVSDLNGTYRIDWDTNRTYEKLNFNYEKNLADPMPPFSIDPANINITVQSHYGETIIDGNNSATTPEGSATFTYAKVVSTRKVFKDITKNSIVTPVRILIYCPPSLFTCSTLNVAGSEVPDWWLAASHDQTKGEGNIGLSVNNGGVVTSSVAITSGGINNTDVTVTNASGTMPNIVTVDTGTDASSSTSPWLRSSLNSYTVEFTGITGWTGYGKTGHIVDSNQSVKHNNRLSW